MVKSGVEVVKGRDILGMPVVIEGQGAEVGKVVDLVISGCFELEAVILESGRSMYVVSMDDLTIGRGILLIKGISSLKPLAPGGLFYYC